MGIEFNIEGVKRKLLKSAVSDVANTTSKIYMSVKSYSPIDTGTYEKGHKNLGVTMKGNRVIGIVENTGDYVERVEGGFRKKPVNWHLKNIGQIYNSKGANVYGKAIAKHKDNFIKNLRG